MIVWGRPVSGRVMAKPRLVGSRGVVWPLVVAWEVRGVKPMVSIRNWVHQGWNSPSRAGMLRVRAPSAEREQVR